MRVPKRRTLGLGGALLLLVLGAWFVMPRSRITQANFYRISDGMTKEEVTAILGPEVPLPPGTDLTGRVWLLWTSGPNWINLCFEQGELKNKRSYFASALETTQWYTKGGLRKLGVIPEHPRGGPFFPGPRIYGRVKPE
jgi:hypothetical protein